MLINTPAQVEQLKAEKKVAYECVQRRECHSEWREDIQEWVIVPNQVEVKNENEGE
jgi:hypothetical protein